ncbi:MAG: polysaccharide deacetylase family protein [Alphaproteobacteria bacterium]|nr:polysaccharide deacetylase family protein [Alphaproteobacteria bacterium]
MSPLRNALSAFGLAAALFLTGGSAPGYAAGIAQDERAAVIFSYHRVGEDEYPANNIRMEQFEAHLRELREGDYNVMGLPAVINALRNGDKLPPRTVVLTFDGGHRSIMENAAPLLLKNDLPFTIFIATDNTDRATTEYMSWDDVKKLARNNLVTVGMHPATYQRLDNAPAAELLRQLNTARAAFRDNLGAEPRFFAYPFGEYSKAYRDVIEKQGFAAAFGEQSGVAYAGADIFALPRFAMTESYGGLDRFLMTAHALPLPVTDISPSDPRLENAQPEIGFTIDPALKGRLKDLSCFAAGQGKPEIQIVGATRVEIRLEKPFSTERARLNCTLPGPAPEPGEDPTWRWFGMMMTLPAASAWSPTPDNDAAMATADESRG